MHFEKDRGHWLPRKNTDHVAVFLGVAFVIQLHPRGLLSAPEVSIPNGETGGLMIIISRGGYGCDMRLAISMSINP